jgi:hypothetical protein
MEVDGGFLPKKSWKLSKSLENISRNLTIISRQYVMFEILNSFV